MIFFLSVLFLCNTTECTFLKLDHKFFKQAECLEATLHAVKSAKEKGLVAKGTCLVINAKDII